MNIFLEINLNSSDCVALGIESRDELEDEISEAIQNANLGEITGGGGGSGHWNIDVEVPEISFNEALQLLQSILQRLKVPRSTKILRYKPAKVTYGVYANG